MKITQRTHPHETPYMVTDSNGNTIFYCSYKHEAQAFIRGVQYANTKQVERDLWTDYDHRFDVMILGDEFHIIDNAKREMMGGAFATESEAWDEVDALIQEDKEQDRYGNNSGR